jgi:hypothetical protein
MVGETLSIGVICALSGLDERVVKKELSRGALVDQTPTNVGLWLRGRIEDKMSVNRTRGDKREERQPIVHSKWD